MKKTAFPIRELSAFEASIFNCQLPKNVQVWVLLFFFEIAIRISFHREDVAKSKFCLDFADFQTSSLNAIVILSHFPIEPTTVPVTNPLIFIPLPPGWSAQERK